jgi:hypothetical protein
MQNELKILKADPPQPVEFLRKTESSGPAFVPCGMPVKKIRKFALRMSTCNGNGRH